MGTTIEELLAFGISERTWIRNLPNSLAELVRLIGLEPTLRLAVHYGGTGIAIPKAARCPQTGKVSVLVSIVGEEATSLLCAKFGTSVLPISSCLHGRMMRRLRWLSLMEKGLSERQATQAVGISKSTHYEWKRLYLEPAA